MNPNIDCEGYFYCPYSIALIKTEYGYEWHYYAYGKLISSKKIEDSSLDESE